MLYRYTFKAHTRVEKVHSQNTASKAKHEFNETSC